MNGAKIVNNLGSITITPNVIANIAGSIATRCYGVVAMAAKGGIGDLVTAIKKDNSKGIKVSIEEDGVDIEIHIVVKYGVNIKAIADSIVKDVNYQVELATGFKVRNVSVNIVDVLVD